MHEKASIPFKFKFCLKLLHGTAFPLQETALLFYASLLHLPSPPLPPPPPKKEVIDKGRFLAPFWNQQRNV